MPKTKTTNLALRLRIFDNFALLVILFIAAALLGGSSRADVLSLVILRPFAVFVAVFAAFRLTAAQFADYRAISLWLGACLLFVALQTVPLPPDIWQALPGRDLIVEIDTATGNDGAWRPYSMNPIMARNAMWSLAVPLAVAALVASLDAEGHRRTLNLLLILGIASALVGVLQFLSGPNSLLYTYKISNNGSALGFFANRNHQGVFLAMLIPLLAAFAASNQRPIARRRRDRTLKDAGWHFWGAVIAIALILPVILATGSRAGMLTAILGLLGGVAVLFPAWRKNWIDTQHEKSRFSKSNVRRNAVLRFAFLSALAAAFVATIALTIGMQSNASLARLIEDPERPDLRWSMWSEIQSLIAEFFPYGSGAGSFVTVFKINEPDAMLSTYYVNKAHNDFLEVALEHGAIGIALLAAGLLLLLLYGWRVWRSPANIEAHHIARGASVALLLLVIGSAVDYPARVPFMAAVAATLVIWLRRGTLTSTREKFKDIND